MAANRQPGPEVVSGPERARGTERARGSVARAPTATGYRADIAPVAALLADPARASMLTALLDGPPLAAGELSQVAGISAATASAHLARLLEGGLVRVTRQGRHRYYRLAGHEVAEIIEVMSRISPVRPVRSLRQSREAVALAEARTCYDHLAGRAGVALLDALLEAEILAGVGIDGTGRGGPGPDGTGPDGTGPDGTGTDLAAEYEVTQTGAGALAAFGVDVSAARRSRRRFAGACLDWTQRRPHLSGALGAAITARLIDLGWIIRGPSRRAVRVTPAGRAGLAETFGWAAAD
jgi:DNA-binding transcriptional ArsR family regulator